MQVNYRHDFSPKTEDIIELFHNSDYFPIKDKGDIRRIEEMFEKADLIVTAWHEKSLIGISRSLTDF